MRKVKFTQDSFEEKLEAILSEFPMLDVSGILLYMFCGLELKFISGPSPFPLLAHECTI